MCFARLDYTDWLLQTVMGADFLQSMQHFRKDVYFRHMRLASLLCFLFLCLPGLAQSGGDKARAADLAVQAERELSGGDLAAAAEHFREARKLDDREMGYLLGEAEARFYLGQHKEVIKLVQPLVREQGGKRDEAVRALRLYGGSLSLLGKSSAARKAIQRGLEEHPKAGELYAELGMLEYEVGRDAAALEAWEAGIRSDPWFPGNYFAAGQALAMQGDLAWAIIYLEQYLNLKRKGGSAKEASRLLLDCYRRAYRCDPRDNCGFVFYQVPAPDYADDYGHFADSPALHLLMGEAYGSDFDGPVDIGIGEVLEMLREGGQALSVVESDARSYFEWLRYVEGNGTLEGYVYWLLQDGAPMEFAKWYEDEADTFAELEHWLGRSRMIYQLKEPATRPLNP